MTHHRLCTDQACLPMTNRPSKNTGIDAASAWASKSSIETIDMNEQWIMRVTSYFLPSILWHQVHKFTVHTSFSPAAGDTHTISGIRRLPLTGNSNWTMNCWVVVDKQKDEIPAPAIWSWNSRDWQVKPQRFRGTGKWSPKDSVVQYLHKIPNMLVSAFRPPLLVNSILVIPIQVISILDRHQWLHWRWDHLHAGCKSITKDTVINKATNCCY